MRATAVAAVSLGLAGAIAGCGGSKAEPSSPAQALLTRVLLRPAQVGSGYRLQNRPDGVGVTGFVTLDLCGHHFATEALRTDRIQVDYVRPNGGVLVSNEVVTYRSGGAHRAIAELEQAASHCPRRPTRSNVAGVGLLLERVHRLPRAGLLPASIALEDSVRRVNSAQRRPITGLLVYQASGNVLSAVYTHHGSLSEQRRIAVAAARASARDLRANR